MKKSLGSKMFRTLAVFLVMIAVIFYAASAQSAKKTTNKTPKILAEQAYPAEVSSLVVKTVKDLSADQQAEVIARNGGVEVSSISALRLHIIEVSADQVSEVLSKYKADPSVESAELNMKRKADGTPSDFYYTSQQWVLAKIGWESVYGMVTPAGTATVAVLDTGIDALHPDLTGQDYFRHVNTGRLRWTP